MFLDPAARDVLVLVALSVGIVGVVVGVFALNRLAHMRRSYALLEAIEGRDTYIDVTARTIEDVGRLREDVRSLDAEIALTRHQLERALRHVSVVRYDAFGDMGGRYSFTAAMLDDAGDGLVLTSIHGRTETRSYLKGISGGVPDIELSPEEQEAVKLARGDAK